MSEALHSVAPTTPEREQYFLPEITSPLTLPGGYIDPESGKLHREITLAPMSGYEEDLLTDSRLGRDGTSLRRIVGNCILKLGDIFEAPQFGRSSAQRTAVSTIVENMLVSDKTFLIIALRRISLKDGDIYRFKTECPNPECKHERIERLDLRELPVLPLRDPSVRVHSFQLPRSKKVVRFRHIYTYDEPKMIELKRKYPDSALSASMYLQVLTMDGEQVTSHRDLQPLSSYDRDELRQAMDDIDGGFDLSVTIECPQCRNVKRHSMEITPPFFIPSTIGSGPK